MTTPDRPDVAWYRSTEPVAYPDAVGAMERRVEAIRAGRVPETVWLLEHPPIYTGGTSARPEELLEPLALPVYPTGRGGRYTYHGPGQRIAYVMLDLATRGRDIRRFTRDLEQWLIRTLATFGVEGECRAGRVGIWVVMRDGSERKIAALGVRVRRWVTFHGISLNVDPDLGRYAGIVPCGIAEHGVTSLAELGVSASLADVDAALAATFPAIFAADIVPAGTGLPMPRSTASPPSGGEGRGEVGLPDATKLRPHSLG